MATPRLRSNSKIKSKKNIRKKPAATEAKSVHRSSIARYLYEIGQTPLLTPAEEQSLAIKIQAGDLDARKKMMQANLRLVVNMAKQYVPGNEQEVLMDLIQEGNIGLMRAVDRFKAEYKTRFSTYGVYWIRQAILRALKSRRLVRLPENVVDRLLEMQRTRQRLYQILGRDPSPEELAKEMKTSLQEIDRLENASNDVVSLEQAVRGRDDEDQTSLQDLLEDVDADEPGELAQASFVRDQIRSAVSTLPPRERKIIEARFGLSSQDPKTLEEIGEAFGISRERVRQLQNVALERLRRRQNIQRVH